MTPDRARQLLLQTAMRRAGIDDEPEILTARHPLQWVEFGWLCVTDRRFRATRQKRKAYFEHRMVKGYRVWFC